MNALSGLLVLAMLTQVLWTCAVMAMAARARFGAARAGLVRPDEVALGERRWPASVQKISNNMQNQFETPTLFYALGLMALYTGAISPLLVVLAWGYVASRVVHTFVHSGGNVVLVRFRVFLAGFACLAAMALAILVRTVSTLGAG